MKTYSFTISASGTLNKVNQTLQGIKYNRYVPNSFAVIDRGNSIHEISLAASEKETVLDTQPQSNFSWVSGNFPSSISINFNNPIDTTSISGLTFNGNPISTYSIENDRSIFLDIGTPIDGLNLVKVDRISDVYGNGVNGVVWVGYSNEETFDRKSVFDRKDEGSQLRVSRVNVLATEEIASVLKKLNKNSEVVESVFISNNASSRLRGWLYFLYKEKNYFDIKFLDPNDKSSIKTGDNKFTLCFTNNLNAEAIETGSSIYFKNTDSSTKYYPTSFNYEDDATIGLGIPPEVMTEGVHYIFIDGKKIVSRNGATLGHKNLIVSSFYIRNPFVPCFLGDLKNVTGTPEEGQSLVFNGTNWVPATVEGGGGGGGAPTTATYVTVTSNGTLTNERVLLSGDYIDISDGGANGNITVDINTSALATIHPRLDLFTGHTGDSSIHFSKSSINLNDLGNVSVGSATVGQSLVYDGVSSWINSGIVIPPTGAPVSASYVVVSLDANLTNDRRLSGASYVDLVDNGANNSLDISVNTGELGAVFVSVPTFISHTGNTSIHFTKDSIALGDLSNVSLKTLTEGEVLTWDGADWTNSGVSSGGGGAPTSASYIVVGLDGTLSNERRLTGGSFISTIDSGANAAFVVNVNTGNLVSSFPNMTGSTFNEALFTGHTGNSSIHFTQAEIDHANLLNKGTNSHATIDSHIADGSIHFLPSAVSIQDLSDVGDFTPVNGQSLYYSGGIWTGYEIPVGSGSPEILNSLVTAVSEPGLVSGRVLEGSTYITLVDEGAGSGLVIQANTTALDVIYPSKSTFQSHTGDTTIHFAKSELTVTGLSDYSGTAVSGDLLKFNGTIWVPETITQEVITPWNEGNVHMPNTLGQGSAGGYSAGWYTMNRPDAANANFGVFTIRRPPWHINYSDLYDVVVRIVYSLSANATAGQATFLRMLYVSHAIDEAYSSSGFTTVTATIDLTDKVANTYYEHTFNTSSGWTAADELCNFLLDRQGTHANDTYTGTIRGHLVEILAKKKVLL